MFPKYDDAVSHTILFVPWFSSNVMLEKKSPNFVIRMPLLEYLLKLMKSVVPTYSVESRRGLGSVLSAQLKFSPLDASSNNIGHMARVNNEGFLVGTKSPRPRHPKWHNCNNYNLTTIRPQLQIANPTKLEPVHVYPVGSASSSEGGPHVVD